MITKPFPTLYSRTSTGAVQVWDIELQGNAFRVICGQQNGQAVVSEWNSCQGKNVGRANEKSPEEQALAEAKAKWEKKCKTGYTPDLKKVDSCMAYTDPMLARKYADVEFEFPVYSQSKLDGIRCIARADGLWSRTGKPIVSAPHISRALAPLFQREPDLILDGELFADKHKDDFNAIVSLAKQSKPTPEDLVKSEATLQYWVYDMPSHPGNFSKRSEAISELLGKVGGCIVVLPTTLVKNQEELDAKYAEYLEDGQEGQIIRLDGPYEHKRSKFLLKRKEFLDEEFEILDITEGRGNRSGMFGRAQCVTKEGIEFEANARGNAEYYTELLKNKQKYIGQMATVRYQNLTPDGKPRFGVIVAIGDDK